MSPGRLFFNGGPIIPAPQLVPIFWGGFSGSERTGMIIWLNGFAGFLSDQGAPVGQEPVVRQYGVYGATVGPVLVAPAITATVNEIQLALFLESQWKAGTIPRPRANVLYLVFMKGASYIDVNGYGTVWCAFHSFLSSPLEIGVETDSDVIYAVIPYPTGNCVSRRAMTDWQSYASHEIMEAATDPIPRQGWVEVADPAKAPFGTAIDEGGDESGNLTVPFPFGVVQTFSDSSRDTAAAAAFSVWAPLLRPHIAVTSWEPDRLDAFVRWTDGAVYHQVVSSIAPTPPSWESLGAVSTTGSPYAVSWGPNRLDVFVRSSSGSLLHKWLDGDTWRPTKTTWSDLGGVLVGPPVAVSWGPDRLDVFAVAADCELWHLGRDGKGWAAWEQIGGLVVGPPSVVAWGPNRLDIFIRGVDGRVYHKAGDGSSWQPSAPDDWDILGGQVIDVPVATSWAPGRLDVFAKGTGGDLFHKSWEGDWQQDDWEPLGGYAVGTPTAVAAEPGVLHVLHRGGDGAMYHKSWAGDWTEWESKDGVLVGGPVAISRGSGNLDVLHQGTDNALYWKRLSTGFWSGWEYRGGTLG